MPRDSITAIPDTGTRRRSHSIIPDQGDDYVLGGAGLSYDGQRLVVSGGTLTLTDGTTVYAVGLDERVIPSPASGAVHYDLDASGPSGDIVVGTAPAAPSLRLGSVDTSAGTTTETNRDPTASFGGVSMASLNGTVRVQSAADLPDAANGTHSLADQTAYLFDGFVTSAAALELGDNSPLLGLHGGVSGFIFTGGAGAALRGSGVPYFSRDMTVSAPGATVLDLTAPDDVEMLVESVSYADPANLGRIASLGTIDGFRVPTFRGANFGDFDGGLTFEGPMEKVFFSECPMRNVDAGGVDILTLAGPTDVAIVDMTGCYIKDVQPDTRVWHVEAGAEPTEVFQYRGNTHDQSVARENVITGPNADPTVEPFSVAGSYPVRDSAVIGELTLDTAATTTLATADTYARINGASSLGPDTQRVSKAADAVLQYDGKRDVTLSVSVSLTMTGANGDTYTVAIDKNGTELPEHVTSIEAGGQNADVSLSLNGIEAVTTTDEIGLKIKNNDNPNDATLQAYSLDFTGL